MTNAIAIRCLFSLVLLWAANGNVALAQTSSLYHRQQASPSDRKPTTLEEGSWTYIPIPPPQPIQLHDIIVVRVDELARMQAEGEMERRKNASYDAVIKDWIFFDGLFTVKPAPQADGDPRMQGTLNQQFRAEGDMETRESLAFNIATEVVDIRPNGNLVLEGHKDIKVNNELWRMSISGLCSADKIGPDRTVLSRDMLHLQIDKDEHGHVRDSYRRGWLLNWIDEFHPF